jgi:plastocyanin
MSPFRLFGTTTAVLLALAIAGCGGGGNNNTTNATTTNQTTTNAGGKTTGTTPSKKGGAAAKPVTVKLKEYSISPSNVTVTQGGRISVENDGKLPHNLTIEQGPNPKQKSKKLAGTPTFPGGTTEILKVRLKPGRYAMACTVPGHRQLGMVGTLTVK